MWGLCWAYSGLDAVRHGCLGYFGLCFRKQVFGIFRKLDRFHARSFDARQHSLQNCLGGGARVTPEFRQGDGSGHDNCGADGGPKKKCCERVHKKLSILL